MINNATMILDIYSGLSLIPIQKHDHFFLIKMRQKNKLDFHISFDL